ncbi:hypothetical protein BFW38_01530 [Terasakiispira papahanaumokuakeensis]|uniref:Probable oxaloacetate decarboxylase gamma chain n=1 Tax=Terasakiispira papahanaumokuakeensis TaxID=197479 RepID=A0A1E2V6E1_9GAMM|nr:OadG family transporter subunit [Terasakiispira papahanaumokuakeensis]ODC02416.1 hypothetical protein BFW38_01530 [Terasakiispira papahanaumokuakeensis]
MSPGALINEGLNLLVYGMGFVFVFLTLLVIATTGMSRLVNHFVNTDTEAESPSPQMASTEDPHLPVVIAAALHHHRHRH